MERQIGKSRFNAARITAMTFGILAGLGGLWHGIGEVLQGNIAPAGIVIESWTQGPTAEYMGGEPGMTVVPNLLITGILTIAISLTIILWSSAFVQKRRGGLVLILLSVAMLLVGGGFGPPLIGILAGIAATGINSINVWILPGFLTKARTVLAALWPWLFGISAVAGTILVVGSLIAIHFLGVTNGDIFTNMFYFTVLALIPAIVCGVARDIKVIEAKMVPVTKESYHD
jgi:hypothetical protein